MRALSAHVVSEMGGHTMVSMGMAPTGEPNGQGEQAYFGCVTAEGLEAQIERTATRIAQL